MGYRHPLVPERGVIGNVTFVPDPVCSEKNFDINGIFLIDKRTLVV